MMLNSCIQQEWTRAVSKWDPSEAHNCDFVVSLPKKSVDVPIFRSNADLVEGLLDISRNSDGPTPETDENFTQIGD
jgi:hypothetical protein